MIVGNVIAFAEVVHAVEGCGHFSRTSLVSLLV